MLACESSECAVVSVSTAETSAEPRHYPEAQRLSPAHASSVMYFFGTYLHPFACALYFPRHMAFYCLLLYGHDVVLYAPDHFAIQTLIRS